VALTNSEIAELLAARADVETGGSQRQRALRRAA
jgi:hypothetical protein